jgi:hypothetical protein
MTYPMNDYKLFCDVMGLPDESHIDYDGDAWRAFTAALDSRATQPADPELTQAERNQRARTMLDAVALAPTPAQPASAPAEAPKGWDAEFLAKRLGRVARAVGVEMPSGSYEDIAAVAGTILGQIAGKLERVAAVGAPQGQAEAAMRDALVHGMSITRIAPADVWADQAQGQAEPVASDFVMVPRVPTDEMLRVSLAIEYPGTYDCFLRHPSNGPRAAADAERDIELAKKRYAAMLAAAPAQPTQAVERDAAPLKECDCTIAKRLVCDYCAGYGKPAIASMTKEGES